MKKIRFLFAVSAALTAFAALAFLNNVVAVVNWWRAFSSAGGDTGGIPAHAPGCFAWLDWSAVDYSAVTTFIPLLGFLCLTRASLSLLRKRRVPAEDFPFFRGSDQLNVALGLLGTLWGIIVIGYFKLDTVQMADLMQCLHTALFSTLMAVVWVFLVDRPLVRPCFRKLLDELDLAEAEVGDLAGAVERLIKRLDAASDAFDRRQAEYEAAFERRQAEYEKAMAKRLDDQQAALAARAESEEKALAARQAKSDEMLAKGAAELARLQGETAAACERHLAEYEKAFEARQQEYVEAFRRVIDELERRAAESETRRAASESKLRAVVAALHE